MSRKSVRNAIATFLGNASPPLQGIGRVYPSPPKISRSSDAYANVPAGTPSGSVLYVEVTQIRERRLASGGPVAGTKEVRYTIRLHLLFRSRQGRAEDAMDDHDDQLEEILERLRTDRTLGTSGAILQYSQDGSGLTVTTGLPKESGNGSILIWSLIDAEAVEVIVA